MQPHGCVQGCCRLYKDKPLCPVCREHLGAPYGMTFNRYSAIAKVASERKMPKSEAQATNLRASKNQTWKYMRVRDRVGINTATPQALIDICRAHLPKGKDRLTRGFITPLGWDA